MVVMEIIKLTKVPQYKVVPQLQLQIKIFSSIG